MSESLRLRLRPNFREPLSHENGFVGREAELERLSGILLHRRAATVLVSGHRGVGKTSLVNQALSRTDEHSVVVRLGLPHLREGLVEAADLRGQVLRSLARSLYFSLKATDAGDDLLRRSEDLYKKTYLTDLQDKTDIAALASTEVEHRTILVQEARLDPSKGLAGLLGTALAGAVAIGGVSTVNEIWRDSGAFAGVVSFIAIAAASAAAAFTLTRRKEIGSTITDRITNDKTISLTGSCDLSPETLEFELQELLAELRAADRKPIFVIDELDKLDGGELAEQIESHVIFQILASLKNFFTMGAGIFIFISGEDFYSRLEESIEDGTYSLAHTLFTDRVFLQVLTYEKVELLLDSLCSDPTDQKLYRRFRNYLCWESRNHVFDLIQILGEFVSEYDDGVPFVHAHESYEEAGHWHEGNLPEDWLLQAGLQKIVGATYDESARPGSLNERFNQALWLTILSVAKDLVRDNELDIPSAGYQASVARQDARAIDDISGAVDRMLARGERYGMLVTSVVTDPDSGEDNLRYAVVDSPGYPPASIGSDAIPTPYEEGFLTVVHSIQALAQHLTAQGVNLDRFQPSIANVVAVADHIKSRPGRQSPPRSAVREALNGARELPTSLLEAGLFDTVENWASTHGFEVQFNQDQGFFFPTQPSRTRPGTAEELSPLLGEFSEMSRLIVDHQVEHALVSVDDRENQLLILFSEDAEVLAALQHAYREAAPSSKGAERRAQRLPVVSIQLASPTRVVKLPEETVSELVPGSNSWWDILQGRKGGRKVSRRKPLGGWTIFAIDASATNLSELPPVLDSVSYLG